MMREQPPQIFAARVFEMPVQFVVDASGFAINEAGKSTQLSWTQIRGMGLAIARGRYSTGERAWIYVAHVPPGLTKLTLMPIQIALDDPQCQALIEALKRTPLWRGQGSALGMRSTLGISNKVVYLTVAGIIGLLLVLSAVAVGFIILISSAPGRRGHR